MLDVSAPPMERIALMFFDCEMCLHLYQKLLISVHKNFYLQSYFSYS